MEKLIHELSKLPSIGQKSATRLAYFLVTARPELAQQIAKSLEETIAQISQCEICFFLSQSDSVEGKTKCSICADGKRDTATVCVVEKPMDVIAVERVAEFRGVYHVLHGLWSPLRGQGPDKLRIKEFEARLKSGGVSEVILATGSTLEGDATAMYLSNLVSQYGIKSTRLAQGIPKGGELEYADEITLSRAFSGRNTIS
jgi:recombination protein RecR